MQKAITPSLALRSPKLPLLKWQPKVPTDLQKALAAKIKPGMAGDWIAREFDAATGRP
jgi:hypothetical protein